MMKSNDHFFQSVCALAIPVALQSMLQSSFRMVDQIMIGQLGEIQVAGVGLAGKFASIYAVLISAIGAAAGIMISQYLGQENNRGVRQSFFANLLLSGGIAGIFTAVCILFPERIMGAYTRDAQTRQTAAEYLALISGTFVPMAGAALLSTLLRCRERPRLPLYASIAAALLYFGDELHSDLRKARACAHGYKGRGQTKYVMFIDGIGTWCCGVPLGLLSAFVLRLPVAWVYFLLSLEECLRFGFSMAVFRRKKWMRRLDAGAQPSGLP